MSEREQPLEGGNLDGAVVRVGETVRRTAGPWTPAVHGLLEHLASRSYPAPRAFGTDDEGREILSFVRGECVHPNHLTLIESEAGVRRVGRLIADYHEAQVGFVPPANAQWREEGRDPTGSTEVLAHNDLAPWNLVAGPDGWTFIDWDLAAPGRRLWDLAWAVHSFVGLWPDSTLTHEQTAARIAAFCDGAHVDGTDRPALLDVVIERTGDHATMLRRRADAGDANFERMVAEGHADVWERGSAHVQTNRELWLRLLDG